MNPDEEERTPAPRGRTRFARVVLLGTVLAAGALIANEAWSGYVEPAVRPRVRDFLAFARIERYREEILAAAAEAGIPADLLAAVIAVESGGRLDARSNKDALGLCQLTLPTARWRAELLGLEPPTEGQLLSDARLNTRLGADTLAWLLDTFDGDVERALMAYNTGTGRLARLVRAAGSWEAWRAEREAAGDSQLLAYAARVLDYREAFRERGYAPLEELAEADAGQR